MEPMMVSTAALEPLPNSVRQAREFFAASAGRLGLAPDVVEMGTLAVSELVTNAVRYGVGPIEVRTVSDRAHVRFEVSDRAPKLPERSEAALSALGGRGLGIVDAVADTWGCERHRDGQGKTIWFTLLRPQRK